MDIKSLTAGSKPMVELKVGTSLKVGVMAGWRAKVVSRLKAGLTAGLKPMVELKVGTSLKVGVMAGWRAKVVSRLKAGLRSLVQRTAGLT
jgi:hypothetical protein